MDFGQAIWNVKNGSKIAREGWNGKGMFVYYVPAASYPAMTDVAKETFGDIVQYNAYLAIKTANGTVSTWAPSGSDALADDWMCIND